jgi:hypothetical protein
MALLFWLTVVYRYTFRYIDNIIMCYPLRRCNFDYRVLVMECVPYVGWATCSRAIVMTHFMFSKEKIGSSHQTPHRNPETRNNLETPKPTPIANPSAPTPNDPEPDPAKSQRPLQIRRIPTHTYVGLTNPALHLRCALSPAVSFQSSRSRRSVQIPLSAGDRRRRTRPAHPASWEFLAKSVNKGKRDCADCGVVLYESLINLKETIEM